MINTLTAHIMELQVAVKALQDAKAGAPASMQDFLADRVERAVSAEPTFARTIYNAMSAEIDIDQRTLMTHVSRIAASFDKDGAIWGEAPTTNVDMARYLAQRTALPNVYGAKYTRRLHSALERLGVKPTAGKA